MAADVIYLQTGSMYSSAVLKASKCACHKCPCLCTGSAKGCRGQEVPRARGLPPLLLSQRMHWHKVIGHGAYGNCGATERTEFATREKGNEGEMRTAAESTYSIQHRKRHQQMPFMLLILFHSISFYNSIAKTSNINSFV